MNFPFSISLLFIVLFGCAEKEEPKEPNPLQSYLITEINVVDVENGDIAPGINILISDEKIQKVSPAEISVPDTVITISGKGKYLIPGLWDMHGHYNWNYQYSSQLLVANGVTGVREMWGDMGTVKEIRKQITDRTLVAPDIYSAGVIIDGDPPIWDGSVGVANPKEATKEVDKQIKEGVDFLKVYSMLTRESYFAIAEHANKKGVPFAGHVPSKVSIWEAMQAGQQSAEHLYGLLEACTNNRSRLMEFYNESPFSPEISRFLVESFDPAKFDSLATALAASDTWISPTLIVLQQIANLDDTTKMSDPRMDYMPPSIHRMWDPKNDFRFKNSGPEYFAAQKAKFDLQLSLMGALDSAGVKIIAGTDFPNPFCFAGFSIHDELQLMVKGGMTPASALKAATYNPALFMGKENEIGLIKEGYTASMVLLEANPLEDISSTSAINGVILRGDYFDRQALNNLLDEAKKYASK